MTPFNSIIPSVHLTLWHLRGVHSSLGLLQRERMRKLGHVCCESWNVLGRIFLNLQAPLNILEKPLSESDLMGLCLFSLAAFWHVFRRVSTGGMGCTPSSKVPSQSRRVSSKKPSGLGSRRQETETQKPWTAWTQGPQRRLNRPESKAQSTT